MKILQLNIHAVRNLKEVYIDCQHAFNVFYGDNGSGKTSILEAIHILGLGKTFRHHAIEPVIHHHAENLAVFARGHSENDNVYQIGIEKNRQGKSQIRFNGQTLSSAAVLAENLPIQLIHPDSDELVTGSPKLRRQFLDWGTFHVEPQFFTIWKKLQKALKQRNAALKAGQSHSEVSLWDKDYITLCEAITQMRKAYLEKLQPIFDEIMGSLLATQKVTLTYQQGWPVNETLTDILAKNFQRDYFLGYTYYGPQRDDLLLSCDGYPAAETLSRGEQKLTIIALRLAQGRMLRIAQDKKCLYLLDDYGAELDAIHRKKVLEILKSLEAQVFLTTIDFENVKNEFDLINPAVFYVEHGEVKPL